MGHWEKDWNGLANGFYLFARNEVESYEKMVIEEHIQLVEDILGDWKSKIGGNYDGYRNHVYRMINFSFSFGSFNTGDREKIVIAGCFHDLGIWSDNTFDYLPPSMKRARDYLVKNSQEAWAPEIELMIAEHHKVRKYNDVTHPTIGAFRKGDLVDFSLGLVKCGLPSAYVRSVKAQFPNAGFHKGLVKTAAKWICRHPLNPVPVLKW